MKLSYLQRSSDFKVKDWLKEELELNQYQISRLMDSDMVRLSPFYFYERAPKEKVSILWRLTAILFLIYYIIMVCFLPFNWMFTGKWGYGRDFIDKFHSKWVRKLGF